MMLSNMMVSLNMSVKLSAADAILEVLEIARPTPHIELTAFGLTAGFEPIGLWTAAECSAKVDLLPTSLLLLCTRMTANASYKIVLFRGNSGTSVGDLEPTSR